MNKVAGMAEVWIEKFSKLSYHGGTSIQSSKVILNMNMVICASVLF